MELNKQNYPALFTLFIFIIGATIASFAGGTWGSLGIGCGLILFGWTYIKDRHMPLPDHDLTYLALLSLFVVGILNLHSTQPQISWRAWLMLGTIFIPLVFLSAPTIIARAWHPKFATVLFAASFIAALALGTELALGTPLLRIVEGPTALRTDYNRGVSGLVLLAFPVMAGLMGGYVPLPQKKRIWLLALFVAALLFPAGQTESRASKLALIVGLFAAFGTAVWPVLMRRSLAVFMVACIGWAFAAREFFLNCYDKLQHFPDSWRARMEIWDYMSYRIMERPYFGWGLGSAHTLPFAEPHGDQYVFTTMPAAHPHDVATQLWVELGLPGLVLGLTFGFIMLQKARRLDARLAPFAVGLWAATLCLCLTAYNFWTDALWGVLAMSAFALAMMNKAKPDITV